MRHIILCILILLNIASVYAKKKETYPVVDIPKELLKRADAVIRLDKTEVFLNSKTEFIIKEHFVVTILNESGKGLASKVVGYDKDSKVLEFSGVLYNSNGKKVKKSKKSDIIDFSATSGYTVFSDNRSKSLSFEYAEYPFTVEFECIKKVNGGFFIPGWAKPMYSRISAQETILDVNVKSGIVFNYKELNGADKYKTVAHKSDYKVYTWRSENVKADKYEDFQPSIVELTPYVMTAVGEFNFEGFHGSLATWNDFGKWSSVLNWDRQKVSEKTTQEVKNIVADITDTRDKVKAVYKYMQGRTRYVSIQEGIGGFRPFPAETVDRLGYGDCKALTNYTLALLKVVGIKSYYTRIYGGEKRKFYKDFPCQQFNHVILTVPLEKDTMWLECTSQNNPANFIAGFTEDRYGLMVTRNGGKLIRTKRYDENDNTRITNANFIVDENGKATGKINIVWRGRQFSDKRSLMNRSVKKHKKYILNMFGHLDFDIVDYSFKDNISEDPSLELSIDVNVNNLVKISDTKMMLKGSSLFKYKNSLKKKSNRKKPFEFTYAYKDIDSVSITLPKGYKMEYDPRTKDIDNEFGAYKYTIDINDNKIVYVRKTIAKEGQHPAIKYNDFVDYVRKKRSCDNQQIILKKI
ncbi:MAG: DUF3857 domain-containing transglutaminase family protein [Bacteroidales bacterium]|jgi:hypothetical protein|nr:DUF3857 domain-containing transglutaminase family protein [Bacteroidales bacterium]